MQRKWILFFLAIGALGIFVGWIIITSRQHTLVPPPPPIYPNAQHSSVANVNDSWKDLCGINIRAISRVTHFQTTDALPAIRQFYHAGLFKQGGYQLDRGYSFLEGTQYSEVFIHETEIRSENRLSFSIGFGVWVQADAVNGQTDVTVSEFTYKELLYTSCDPG